MRIRDISIKNKQVLIMTVISAISLSMAGGAFLALETHEFHRSRINETSALAQVVGDNTKAAISFDNADSARATLSALNAHPDVLYAAVLLTDGTLFADYQRDPAGAKITPDPELPVYAQLIEHGELKLTRGITLNGRHIGHIYILTDLSVLYARLKQYTEVLIVILLATLLVSLMLGTLLQRVITNPILHLAETSQTVTEKNDYSIRAAQASRDEIGHLIASFNNMLSQIENRDAALSRSHDELAKLGAQNELILNAAGEGICGIDREGLITFANPAAAHMLKRPQGRMIGAHVHEVFHSRIGSVDEGPCEACARLLDGQWHHLDRESFTWPDGETFHVELISTPIIQDGGRHTGTVLTFNDITRRVEAEQKLQTYAKRLAESNEELQKFAYVASHDLQEPLRKVRAFGDRLTERYRDDLDERAQLYIERMQKAAERMQNLVHDLLMFSRVAQQDRPLKAIDLNRVVEQAISDLEIPIEQTGARIDYEPLPTVNADRSQMCQVFQNLLSNAIKFQKPGEPPRVSIRAETVVGPPDENGEHETFWQIHIEDQGIGFDEKYNQRIFEVFQRLQGQSDASGTGIGLAICKKIVERHGGTIQASGQPGVGACFTLSLPAATAAVEVAHE